MVVGHWQNPKRYFKCVYWKCRVNEKFSSWESIFC